MNFIQKTLKGAKDAVSRWQRREEMVAFVPKVETRIESDSGDYSKRVNGWKRPRIFPLTAEMRRCRAGFFVRSPGHTSYSGPCPTPAGATRTAAKFLKIGVK
jgi:hypothetical protein